LVLAQLPESERGQLGTSLFKRTNSLKRKNPRTKNGILSLPLPRSKYQIFPELPPACRAALKNSIRLRGVDESTTWDDEGNLLHGWERESCGVELGIVPPREVRHFATEAEKFQFILAANVHRRPNLNRMQKREVIAAYLRGDPGVADNMLSESLGVSKNT